VNKNVTVREGVGSAPETIRPTHPPGMGSWWSVSARACEIDGMTLCSARDGC